MQKLMIFDCLGKKLSSICVYGFGSNFGLTISMHGEPVEKIGWYLIFLGSGYYSVWNVNLSECFFWLYLAKITSFYEIFCGFFISSHCVINLHEISVFKKPFFQFICISYNGAELSLQKMSKHLLPISMIRCFSNF